MGYSILRHRVVLYPGSIAPVSKGKEVNIPLAGCGFYGNISKVRDVGKNPWESYLFFLTASDLGIGLSRDKVVRLAEHLNLRGVRCVLDDP